MLRRVRAPVPQYEEYEQNQYETPSNEATKVSPDEVDDSDINSMPAIT